MFTIMILIIAFFKNKYPNSKLLEDIDVNNDDLKYALIGDGINIVIGYALGLSMKCL